MADTMTTGHGHDERNEDHGAAPSYVVPNSWEHARRREPDLAEVRDRVIAAQAGRPASSTGHC